MGDFLPASVRAERTASSSSLRLSDRQRSCRIFVMANSSPRSLFPPRRILLGVVAVVIALFVVDLIWYQCRVRMPSLGAAGGSIHRLRLLAIAGKGNKLEYQVDSVRPEEDVPCSHSLFPQGGNRPCWYVKKHANDPIPM